MRTVTLLTPARSQSYPIHIGTGTISQLKNLVDLGSYSKVFVVTDENVAGLWLSEVTKALTVTAEHLVLPAGEKAKHIRSAERIWTAMHHASCDRKTLVITLGGGVIGDMGGFAAATYMRGVDCLHIPTTLLSQIDSSVGGKTAIDFDGVKNLIGTFSQPVAVIIDTKTLATLPDREFLSGFAEIIKHGLIRDNLYFKKVTSKHPREFSAAELEDIITTSCRIKAQVVEGDETESGIRKILNFGHTVGHAIESLSLDTSKPLLHGEAVSIGMVIEAELSRQQGYLNDDEARSVKRHLQTANLPVASPRMDIPNILQKLRSDKKNEYGVVKFTLLRRPGEALWNQEISENTLVTALENNMEKLK